MIASQLFLLLYPLFDFPLDPLVYFFSHTCVFLCYFYIWKYATTHMVISQLFRLCVTHFLNAWGYHCDITHNTTHELFVCLTQGLSCHVVLNLPTQF